MFALLLLQALGRNLILNAIPIVRAGAPPGTTVNLVILMLVTVGLALSLWNQHRDHVVALTPGS